MTTTLQQQEQEMAADPVVVVANNPHFLRNVNNNRHLQYTTSTASTSATSGINGVNFFNSTADNDNNNNIYAVDPRDRYNNNNYNNNNNNNNNDNNNYVASTHKTHDTGRDAYEFVAFLLWYLFLVLCCVIPTCCAYRRRRLVEARIAQQQASVNRIERQNLFILSSLRQSQVNSERIREQRGTKIAERLKQTTMTVQEHHLIDLSGVEQNDLRCTPCVVKVVDEPPPQQPQTEDGGDTVDSSNNKGSGKPLHNNNNVAVEYDVEAADSENTHALQLTTTIVPPVQGAAEGNPTTPSPSPSPSSPTTTATATQVVTRMVPGACAICLCPYEHGDEVTWSPREECQHAFHSECIIPWLAKSDEPKCPCCRQDYCDPVPLSQLQIDPVSLFGANATFVGGLGGDGTDDDIVIPHFMRTLEASRMGFLSTLEFAARELNQNHHSNNNNNIDTSNHNIGNSSDSPTTTTRGTAAAARTANLDNGSPFEFANGSPFEIANGRGDTGDAGQSNTATVQNGPSSNETPLQQEPGQTSTTTTPTTVVEVTQQQTSHQLASSSPPS